MTQVVVDGVVVRYRLVPKEGAPLLCLLHGWGNSLDSFDALSSALGARFGLLAVDLPGFGGSGLPKANWGVGEYAQFVVHFLEKSKVVPDVLVGHSFGGRVAIFLCGHKLVPVRELVLIDSAGIPLPSSPREKSWRIVAKIGRALTSVPIFSAYREKLRGLLYRYAGSQDYKQAGRLREIFLQVVRQDLSREASDIRVPTLLVWGENDSETPLALGQALQKLIPVSYLEIVPESGHAPHIERPQEVARLIESFLLS